MPIITFWSNSKKQTGQTMSAVAVACNMAIEHNYKILLVSTKYNDNSLELCFSEAEKNKSLLKTIVKNPVVALDSGIEGLYKLANSGRIDPQYIQNYTKMIYKNRLEVLFGYKKSEGTSVDLYTEIREKYKEIIQNASKFYDMIILDLDKGLEDEVNKQILELSDLIVVNVEQKIDMIDDFIALKHNNEIFKKDNIILNIGRFDSFSKYSIKNISRYVGIKKDITAIPYNTLYFEAASEESVADLFLRIRKVDPTDRNANFTKNVKEAIERIIYKIQELQMKM